MSLPYTEVGRYDLLLPIGRGGVGQVYLGSYAVAPGVKRYVAIKLVHPSLQSSEEEDSALLVREAKLASRVRHPNVVEVLETGVHDGRVFLAFDYVEGTTLARMITWAHRNKMVLPIPVIGRIVTDALSGLQAAHELRDSRGAPLGLVHRDFTPQNILVGIGGASLLTDFGVAKAHEQTVATSTGVVKGKVAYMAPEQALGRALDQRVDVWSAGIVMWEALTTMRLFRQSTDAATLLAIVTPTEVPPASTRRPDVPAGVDEALSAALQHDPEKRLATAAELRRRLIAALETVGGVAAHEEVARWVERVAGDELAARRQALADTSAVGVSGTARPAVEAAVQTSSVEVTDTTTSADTSDLPPKRRRRWAAPFALIIIVVGGVALMVGPGAVYFGAGGQRDPSNIRVAAEPPMLAATTTGVIRVLKVTADVAFVQVAIGSRLVVLSTAVREVELPLREGEATRRVTVTVTTPNARRGSVIVSPGEGHAKIAISSPGAVAPRPRRRIPKKAAPGSSAATGVDREGLAGSPY